jgi:hypothetical protein
MSYIGNPIVSTDFPKDTFTGNGSTTAFTMSIAPASVNAVIVIVSGVTQDPSTYTISGTTLTFSAAPPSGTSNISVRHLGVAGIPNTPSAASVGISAFSATGTPSSSTFLRGDNTWAAAGGGTVIPAGTVMLFYQAAAPTGFTQVTTQNNKALRVVSGTGGGTGGSVAFTTAFAANAVGATTITTSTMPSHSHTTGAGFANCGAPFLGSTSSSSSNISSGSTGGDGSHTHSFQSLAVQYIDIILASKN